MGHWAGHDRVPPAAAPGDVRAARPGQAAASPRRPHPGRAHGPGHRAGAAALPRQAALDPLLRPARRRPGRDDRPARRPARRAGGDVPADAARPRAHARGRPRYDAQDPVEAVRRRAGRVGADALPRPGHDVRLLARPAAGWRARSARPARAGCSATCPPRRSSSRCRGGPVAGPRRGARGLDARRRGPRLQRGVHGHGRAAGQLQGRDRRRTPSHRAGARRPGHERPRRDRLHRRPRPARSTSSPTRASRSRWRCRCTRRTTSCATSWSRSTPASRSTRPSTPRGTTRGSPSAASRSSTP